MSGISPRTRALVKLRDDNLCVRCGGQGTNIHHRCPRKMGGTSDPRINMPANLLVLCGSGTTGCHGYLEGHRERAREMGYLLRDVDLAEDVPVQTWQGLRTYGNDGKAYLVEAA